jgi:tetratricopeptide (TPR) repeat protein
VAQAKRYPVHFYELDQIYQAAGVEPERRLKLMEENHEVVLERDDAVSRMIALKVTLGKYDDAIELMTDREFEVWEGGENNVAAFWTEAHLLRGHGHAAAGNYQEALSDYQTAGDIPSNLPSALLGLLGRKIEIAYWTGVTYEAMGDTKQAREAWEAVADLQPIESRWRRFLPPLSGSVERYYQALSLRQLGRAKESRKIFQELVDAANEIFSQASVQIDSSAAVEQQQNARDRLSTAHYVAGLGYIGLNQVEKAQRELTAALHVSPDHVGARNTLAAYSEN